MRIRRRIAVLSSAALWISVVLIAQTTAQTKTTVIDVTAPRPLREALDALEKAVGSAINYEDPPYENMADLETITLPRCPACVVIIPRTGHVTASIETPVSAFVPESEVAADTELLLADYRRNALPGEFKIERANGMIYVVPTSVLSADGAMHAVTSPLLTRVTIPMDQRGVGETAELILHQVERATGLRIAISSPFLPPDMVSFGSDNEPARDALARLLAKASGAPVSYRLLFDPKPNGPKRSFDYTLNVHFVGNSRGGAPQSPPQPREPSPPPNGPRPGQMRVNQ